jgi:hypothetical protein
MKVGAAGSATAPHAETGVVLDASFSQQPLTPIVSCMLLLVLLIKGGRTYIWKENC